MILPLEEVVYDSRARDGTWCTLPYPNHKKGCPNFPKCMLGTEDFSYYEGYKWFAIIEEFDLKAHMKKMKERHPHWTELQSRNVLYWQGGVRSRLRKRSQKFALVGDVILDIPERNGVNVYATMAKVGLTLKSNPDYVYKVMLVGERKT